MMKRRLRYAAPSLVTYTALACGFTSLLLTSEGRLTWAGIFIILAVIVDLFDGIVARALHASSAFGMQLDSLADVIDCGVGPVFLACQTLRLNGTAPQGVIAVLGFIYLSAGVFRLARFNLMKAGQTRKSDETVGLTISTSGLMLTMAVLTGQTYTHMTGWLVLPALVVLPFVMVSRVRFPEAHILLAYWRWNLVTVLVGVIACFRVAPQAVALSFMAGYITFGILRAVVHLFPHRTPSEESPGFDQPLP